MEKTIIGSNTYVKIADIENIPAKIDTGADSSSIWASNIEITSDGVLQFSLFGPSSEFYNGEILKHTDYKVVVTRNSHGGERLSYRTHIPIKIHGRKINVLFALADRSHNNFPILIGKRTIKGKFIVDVSQESVVPAKNPKTKPLNKQMRQDPYKFHQKYAKNISGAKK